MNTPQGVKLAFEHLHAILAGHVAEERNEVFMTSSGVMVVEAMRSHGMALDVKKIQELGKRLPEAESPKAKTAA